MLFFFFRLLNNVLRLTLAGWGLFRQEGVALYFVCQNSPFDGRFFGMLAKRQLTKRLQVTFGIKALNKDVAKEGAVPCKLEVEAKGARRRQGEASQQWVAGYSLRFALLTDVNNSVRKTGSKDSIC